MRINHFWPIHSLENFVSCVYLPWTILLLLISTRVVYECISHYRLFLCVSISLLFLFFGNVFSKSMSIWIYMVVLMLECFGFAIIYSYSCLYCWKNYSRVIDMSVCGSMISSWLLLVISRCMHFHLKLARLHFLV